MAWRGVAWRGVAWGGVSRGVVWRVAGEVGRHLSSLFCLLTMLNMANGSCLSPINDFSALGRFEADTFEKRKEYLG